MKLIPSTRSFLRLFQPLSHFVLVPPAIYIRIRFISSSCRKFVFIFRLPLSDGTSRIESAASLSLFLSSSLLIAIERNGQLSADLSTPPFQKRGVRARGSWKMKCWNVAIKNPTSPPECSLGHVAYKTLVACSCSFFAARATNFSKLLHLWMVPPIPLDNLEEDAPVPKSRYTYVDSSDTYVDTGWFYVIIPLGRRTARSARGNESFTEHWTIGCNLSNGNGRGEVSLTACNVIYWRRKFSRIFLSRNGRTADRAFVLLREQAGKN